MCTCRALAALFGGRSPQSRSTRRAEATTSFACSTRIVSSARCRAPRSETRPPPSRTSSAQSAAPDAFERAVNRHLVTMPSALERADAHYSTLSARFGGRVDNTLDPAIANAIAGRGPSPSQFDERSPDTIDPALQTHTPLAQVVTGSRFGWGAFGIGAGSMLGLLLLVGGRRIAAHAKRSKRAQPSPA